jgi:hypothetical protein
MPREQQQAGPKKGTAPASSRSPSKAGKTPPSTDTPTVDELDLIARYFPAAALATHGVKVAQVRGKQNRQGLRALLETYEVGAVASLMNHYFEDVFLNSQFAPDQKAAIEHFLRVHPKILERSRYLSRLPVEKLTATIDAAAEMRREDASETAHAIAESIGLPVSTPYANQKPRVKPLLLRFLDPLDVLIVELCFDHWYGDPMVKGKRQRTWPTAIGTIAKDLGQHRNTIDRRLTASSRLVANKIVEKQAREGRDGGVDLSLGDNLTLVVEAGERGELPVALQAASAKFAGAKDKVRKVRRKAGELGAAKNRQKKDRKYEARRSAAPAYVPDYRDD